MGRRRGGAAGGTLEAGGSRLAAVEKIYRKVKCRITAQRGRPAGLSGGRHIQPVSQPGES